MKHRFAWVLLVWSALAGGANADNLLGTWRAAQARDPSYLAARQTLQLAQQGLSQAQLQVARERLALAEQELALRAAAAYFSALVAQQQASVALSELNAMAEQLRWAQRGAEAGTATPADVRYARSRFDLARAQRVAATGNLDRRRGELEKLTGRKPELLDGLRTDVPLWSPAPADPGFWATLASETHPRVRLQQAVLDAAGQEVARRRDGGAPSVDITASRSRLFNDSALAAPSEMALRARSAQLGLVLTVPLSEDGMDGRLGDALALQDKAQAELAAARGIAGAQARMASAGLAQGLARADALGAALRTGRAAFDAVQAQLRAGARFRPEAFLAVQQFFHAEREWSRARVEAVLQGLQLKAAAGKLDEPDLAVVNAMLAPAPAAPQ